MTAGTNCAWGQTLVPGDIVIGNGLTGGGYTLIRVDPASGAQTAIASVQGTWGLCIDDQNGIYTAKNYTISRYDWSTGLSSVISTGGFLSEDPNGLAVEPTGTILAACQNNIVRINPRTGAQSVLVTGNYPLGVAVSPSGRVWVIRGISTGVFEANPITGQIQNKFYGLPGSESVLGPIAWEQGDKLIVGLSQYSLNKSQIMCLDSSTGARTTLAQYTYSTLYPSGVGVLPDGDIVCSSLGFMSTHQVFRLNPQTGASTTLCSIGGFWTTGLAVVPPTAPSAVTWTGVAGNSWLNGDSARWRNRFDPGTYTNGLNVVFDDTADTGSINIPSDVSPSSVRVANLMLTYTFSGAAITGQTGLTKDCLGTLVVNNVNTYTGPTTINAGTFRIGGNGHLSDLSEIRLAAGATFEREISAGGSYAGHELRSTFINGLGSKASVLAGTNNSSDAKIVSMQWRSRRDSETFQGLQTPPILHSWGLVSDVVTLSGMTGGFTQPDRTDTFVLQMTYNPSQLVLLDGQTENSLAAKHAIYLAWLNPVGWNGTDPLWENAIEGNFGNNASLLEQGYLGSFDAFQLVYGTDLGSYIGAWGVDTANNMSWGVLNHNSDFAVAPEPATLALLALGGLALLRRRGRKRLAL